MSRRDDALPQRGEPPRPDRPAPVDPVTASGPHTTAALFRALVEAAHEGICAMDPQGRITYVNPRMAEMVGHPVRQIVGRPVFDFMPEASAFESRTAFARRQRGISETRELELRRADGSVLWVMASMSPLIGERGTFDGALAMVSDLTERRMAETRVQESERRFRALVEHSTELIAIVDAEGRIGYVNPAFARVLGYLPEEVLGVPCFDFVHPDDRAHTQHVLARVLAEPHRVHHVEYRAHHRDGTERTLMTTARNFSADPAVGGIVLNSRDITEERALGAQLRQAQKMEAIGRLAGGIAHDFNNLLQVISTSIAFAAEDLPAGSVVQADLAAAEAAAVRAAQLTRQLLAFGRRQVLRPRTLDLNHVVADHERMLRRVLGADIVLTVKPHAAAATVHADPGQIGQVVLNLVVNARDAMPGGGTLTIETANHVLTAQEAARRPGAVPGPYVALHVRDTGTGMDEATQAHAFEPFFTTKPIGQGTGLGLATVYGIVQQSGGLVSVHSVPGAGSTFTVLLPQHAVPATGITPRDTPAVRGGPETVLLVEDDEAVRTSVRRTLERGGYRVVEAAHGAAALALIDSGAVRADAVVTDAVMPEMGASRLVAELRERDPATRVVVITGYSTDVASRQGPLGDDVLLLHKPVSPEDLLRCVREALDRRVGPVRENGAV